MLKRFTLTLAALAALAIIVTLAAVRTFDNALRRVTSDV